MAYVYLLSTYDEHGSEDVVATLDRTKLPDLLLAYTCYDKDNDRWEKHKKDQCLPELTKILEDTDEKISRDGNPLNLSDGWGGIQLHVVELK